MNTEPAKHDAAEERETAQAIAEQRAKQRPEKDEEDSARVGLLRITRPLDITSDDMGVDPYNSTGRFTRKPD